MKPFLKMVEGTSNELHLHVCVSRAARFYSKRGTGEKDMVISHAKKAFDIMKNLNLVEVNWLVRKNLASTYAGEGLYKEADTIFRQLLMEFKENSKLRMRIIRQALKFIKPKKSRVYWENLASNNAAVDAEIDGEDIEEYDYSTSLLSSSSSSSTSLSGKFGSSSNSKKYLNVVGKKDLDYLSMELHKFFSEH
tara:strand:- start:284 stop:862 length:579 start_codon:yes stop_codon:yes gene_type:complete